VLTSPFADHDPDSATRVTSAKPFEMTLTSPQLRRFVRRALVDTTGVPAPSVPQIASAFDSLCKRLRTRLQPLFGGVAISALFGRSLHLAVAEFPWLQELVPADTERCALDTVPDVEGRFTTEMLQEGLGAILAHDIALLSTFIGEDFVLPLVQQAWGTVSPAAEKSARSEGELYE
jgi:hypothetical protein